MPEVCRLATLSSKITEFQPNHSKHKAIQGQDWRRWHGGKRRASSQNEGHPKRWEVSCEPAGIRNLRSILHIGADKCGSSSIQAFLSRHHSLKTGPTRSQLNYACISKNGLKTDTRIEKNLKRSISGYLNSLSTSKLAQIPPQRQQSIQKAVAATPGDLIFSCEGWLRTLQQPKGFDAILELVAPPSSNRDVELIAFVRPPVKWVNSAWWQWGVWGQESDFESWLETAIGAVQWFKYLNQAKIFPKVSRLTVEPVYQDVVRQLIDILCIQDIDNLTLPTNQSLPAEALQLFSQHRKHRPNAHSSFNDFLIGHTIAANINQYSPTPWVLSRDHINRILEATYDSNCHLLKLMDETNRRRVQEDPHWWSEDAYAKYTYSPPHLNIKASQVPSYQLASDLFESLAVAVQLLRSRGLLQTYLESLSSSTNNES
jgi:hypothetical protein